MTTRIHNVDGNIIELYLAHDGQKVIEVNGGVIVKGFVGDNAEKFHDRFEDLVECLKRGGYEYEEYIIDRGSDKEETESQFVLMEELPDGSLEDLNFSDDRSELQRILRESELDE